MDVLVIVLAAAAAFLIITVVGSIVFFDFAVRRKVIKENSPKGPVSEFEQAILDGKKWLTTVKTEKVTITSFDGLKLGAFILEAEEKTDKLVLMMHGYRSQGIRDFACKIRYFHDAGFNVFVPDQRCHGTSEGKYITYGIKERFDCRDWINFAVSRYGEQCKIYLMGVSMGCATVVMALGLDLPKNVKGCIADCGYTSPLDIYKHVMRKSYHLPPFPIVYAAGIICRFVAGFKIDEYSTLDALEKNKVPILFVHGKKDDFVPVWMSEKNFQKCTAPKELLLIEGAAHAEAFWRDTKTYWQAVRSFTERYN